MRRRHPMRTPSDRMPPGRNGARRSGRWPGSLVGRTVVEFDRSPARVWEALQDVEAHPLTGKMMKSVEFLPSGLFAEVSPGTVVDQS